MLETSLELLKKIEKNGFECYIVGGFARDYYMKKKSCDVDICTNAKPRDLMKIFDNATLPKEQYGALTLFYKGIRFEITTYRKEIKYINRKPIEIEYINDLYEDLTRRDFTINTLCINSKGEIKDILNGIYDINRKLIKVVGDANSKFKEDPLRMLRAIRFATQLNFKLDKSIIKGIKENAHVLNELSFQRKKDELNKIFASTNIKCGIKLISDLGLDKYLNLNNMKNVKLTTDIIGIWAQLDVLDIFPFTQLEKNNILKLNDIVKRNKIDRYTLYKHGLYLCTIAAEIMGINRRNIIKMEKKLSIHSKKDINISGDEICKLLNKEPGKWLGELYSDIELKIILSKLQNNNKKIKQYIIKNN